MMVHGVYPTVRPYNKWCAKSNSPCEVFATMGFLEVVILRVVFLKLKGSVLVRILFNGGGGETS